ncbi:MAG: molybdenum cofactor guanylyltransferase [Pseudomonadota bacterium]
MRILGAVIAGGQSTRMGAADKLALPWEGRTLVAHVAARLAAQLPELHGVVVNISRDKAKLLPKDIPIVPDAKQRMAGPLAGLEAVMKHGTDHGFTHVLTCAGDTPFLPGDLVERLTQARGEVRILRTGVYPQPLFAMWPVALGGDLCDFLDEGQTFKVMAFAKRYDLEMVDVPAANGIDPFFNINTPEDLQEAHSLIKQAQATKTVTQNV